MPKHLVSIDDKNICLELTELEFDYIFNVIKNDIPSDFETGKERAARKRAWQKLLNIGKPIGKYD